VSEIHRRQRPFESDFGERKIRSFKSKKKRKAETETDNTNEAKYVILRYTIELKSR